jgi:hypothetical protein
MANHDNITIDGDNYQFGGLVTTINGQQYIFQELTVSNGTNVIELEGSQGEVISQVFIGRPKEASGTAILETDTALLVRGDEFTAELVAGQGTSTFLITETSISKSNGAFSTQTFSAREKLNP